jgi:hypothetical protein
MIYFKFPNWKTIWTTDIVVERNINYFFFVVTCTFIYKVFIQIDEKRNTYRCFITNGISISDFNISKAIEMYPEINPLLINYNILK